MRQKNTITAVVAAVGFKGLDQVTRLSKWYKLFRVTCYVLRHARRKVNDNQVHWQ